MWPHAARVRYQQRAVVHRPGRLRSARVPERQHDRTPSHDAGCGQTSVRLLFSRHGWPQAADHQRGHGFNRLVMRSNKPEAKEIQTWIVRDLPRGTFPGKGMSQAKIVNESGLLCWTIASFVTSVSREKARATSQWSPRAGCSAGRERGLSLEVRGKRPGPHRDGQRERALQARPPRPAGRCRTFGSCPAPNRVCLIQPFPGLSGRRPWTNNEPWFIAADVCNLLGLTARPTMTLQKLPVDEKRTSDVPFPGMRGSRPNIINEAGFNRLMMRSNKPEALEIQGWIANAVLPAIRWARTAAQGWHVHVKDEEKVATVVRLSVAATAAASLRAAEPSEAVGRRKASLRVLLSRNARLPPAAHQRGRPSGGRRKGFIR